MFSRVVARARARFARSCCTRARGSIPRIARDINSIQTRSRASCLHSDASEYVPVRCLQHIALKSCGRCTRARGLGLFRSGYLSAKCLFLFFLPSLLLIITIKFNYAAISLARERACTHTHIHEGPSSRWVQFTYEIFARVCTCESV